MSDVVDDVLQVRRDGDRVVASGELDLVGGPLLDAAIREVEAAGGQVVIDLARVSFVDSSGLRCLIAASQRSAELGRRVRLVAPTAAVTRLLEITATASMFDVD